MNNQPFIVPSFFFCREPMGPFNGDSFSSHIPKCHGKAPAFRRKDVSAPWQAQHFEGSKRKFFTIFSIPNKNLVYSSTVSTTVNWGDIPVERLKQHHHFDHLICKDLTANACILQDLQHWIQDRPGGNCMERAHP